MLRWYKEMPGKEKPTPGWVDDGALGTDVEVERVAEIERVAAAIWMNVEPNRTLEQWAAMPETAGGLRSANVRGTKAVMRSHALAAIKALLL